MTTILIILLIALVTVQSLRLHWSKQDNAYLQQDIADWQTDYNRLYQEGLYWYQTVQEIAEQQGIYNL